MNLKRTTWDAILLSAFAIVIVLGLSAIFPDTAVDPEPINQKHAVAEFGYCNASDAKPCVMSFSLDAQGSMLINLITPRPTYPEFYITIADAFTENRYECARLNDLPTNILCTGPQMNLGKPLRFAMFALDDDRLLANGSFNIIGLLLATPASPLESASTPTQAALTPIDLNLFPVISTPAITPTITPTVTPVDQSYPNPTPAYPNPSYP